jgi:hypothetical protein
MPPSIYTFVDTQGEQETVNISRYGHQPNHKTTMTTNMQKHYLLNADVDILKPKTKSATTTTTAVESLNIQEKNDFEQCEETLQRGLRTFFEVGSALLRIRDGKLYRTSHSTFESYCLDRWSIGRSYAWRVIGAAERVKLLPSETSILKPTNEFQIRPFLKLKAEMFPKAWQQAVQKANNGKVTPCLVRTLIAEISSKSSNQNVKRRNPKPTDRKIAFGEIISLLSETRRAIEKHQTEGSLESLQKLEDLLTRVILGI